MGENFGLFNSSKINININIIIITVAYSEVSYLCIKKRFLSTSNFQFYFETTCSVNDQTESYGVILIRQGCIHEISEYRIKYKNYIYS